MKSLVFIILAGYAVRCDDTSNNYYVIQMPDDDPTRDLKKTFKVFWNVPTMQCKSKKIPFEDLFEKFGIVQNEEDRFRGERIAILYDPGLFPALFKNETTGKFRFRNGGVPQEGDLEKHLDAFRNEVDKSIPDPNFNGVGIIDFESWRPIFRQNFGVLVPYKDVSYEIEKKIHWWWPKGWIQEEARKRFEESARVFMQETLSIAKQMRPNALWGYYGFPYCFNMAGNYMQENCSDKIKAENDQMKWLWLESTALFPSIYSSKNLSSSELSSLIRGRVREAARTARGAPVLPYFWFKYREGGYLSEKDLNRALQTLYQSAASGFIIWGSSNDVNTVDKCIKLLDYVNAIFGPAISKYTKYQNRLTDEIANEIQTNVINNKTVTDNMVIVNPIKEIQNGTNANNDENVYLDPEFHWNPPDNYTDDLIKNIDEELFKKPISNLTVGEYIKNNTESTNITDNIYNGILIELLINSFYKEFKDKTNSNVNVNKRMNFNDNSTKHNSLTEAPTTFASTLKYDTTNIPETINRTDNSVSKQTTDTSEEIEATTKVNFEENNTETSVIQYEETTKLSTEKYISETSTVYDAYNFEKQVATDDESTENISYSTESLQSTSNAINENSILSTTVSSSAEYELLWNSTSTEDAINTTERTYRISKDFSSTTTPSINLDQVVIYV